MSLIKIKDDNGNFIEIPTSQAILGGDVLPIGTMVPYGNTEAPANWLVCDGSEISRVDFADLFAVIGTSYGEGDGILTFNLPDKRGKISVGLDSSDSDFNTVGKTGGEKEHTLTIAEMPSHNHAQRLGDNGTITGSGSYDWSMSDTARNYDGSDLAQSTGGNQPHNNLQPYQVDNWIIKAFHSGVVTATTENSLSSNSTLNVPTVAAVNNGLDQKVGTIGGFLCDQAGVINLYSDAEYNVFGNSVNYTHFFTKEGPLKYKNCNTGTYYDIKDSNSTKFVNLLYSSSSTSTTNAEIIASTTENVYNYDLIYVEIGTTGNPESENCAFVWHPTSTSRRIASWDALSTYSVYGYLYAGSDGMSVRYLLREMTSYTDAWTFTKVYGIKF